MTLSAALAARARIPDPDYEDQIICPHCGYDDSDDRYYGEGCYEGLTCGSCDGEYGLTVHVSIRYSTKAVVLAALDAAEKEKRDRDTDAAVTVAIDFLESVIEGEESNANV
jgi:hypothetical protein